MIIKSTLSAGFSLVWENDPALDRPRRDAFDLGDDGDAAFAKAEAAFANKLRVAEETGNYGAVLKPGERPTLFSFELIRGKHLHRLQGLRRSSGQKVEGLELCVLAFRMALTGVDNYDGAPSTDKAIDPDFPDLGPMLPDQAVRQIESDAGHWLITAQLGDRVYARSVTPRPK